MHEIIEGRMRGKPTNGRIRTQMLHDVANDGGYVTFKWARLWNDLNDLYCVKWDVKLCYTMPYLKWAAEDREGLRHRERMSKTCSTAEDYWCFVLTGLYCIYMSLHCLPVTPFLLGERRKLSTVYAEIADWPVCRELFYFYTFFRGLQCTVVRHSQPVGVRLNARSVSIVTPRCRPRYRACVQCLAYSIYWWTAEVTTSLRSSVALNSATIFSLFCG